MSFKKRLVAILAVCLMAELVWYAGITKMTVQEKNEENTFFLHKDTLYLWYMDESLTDYLNSAAVEYNEKYNRYKTYYKTSQNSAPLFLSI